MRAATQVMSFPRMKYGLQSRMNATQLYQQLYMLAAEMPDFTRGVDDAGFRWMAQVLALLNVAEREYGLHMGDRVSFSVAAGNVTSPILAESSSARMRLMLHKAIAHIELQTPPGVGGAFIQPGAALDGYQAIGKIMGASKVDVLIVDPYLSPTTIGEFGVLAPEGVNVRFLTDSKSTKSATLTAGIARWNEQFGT